MRIHKIITMLAILAGAMTLPACSVNPVTGKKELSLISNQQEIQMGQEAAPQFEQEFGGKVDNSSLQQYVNTVGQRVASRSDRTDMPYEFAVLNSDVPNAFALPGGKIFITAGLMSAMQNERELAAVLGHEIGHVAYKHSVKGLQRQLGAQVFIDVVGAVVGADKKEAAQAAAKVSGAMLNLRYSRTDEYQADSIGIVYMQRAGYNPWGMVQMLTVLNNLGQSESSFKEMFQTHPMTTKRVDEARNTVQQKYPGVSAGSEETASGDFLRAKASLPVQKSK